MILKIDMMHYSIWIHMVGGDVICPVQLPYYCACDMCYFCLNDLHIFHIISHVFFASGELCWLCQSIPFLQCSSISYTIYMILNACQMRCWLDNPTIYCLDVPVEIWASCNWGSGANGGSQNLEIRRTLLVMIENDYCMFPKWRGGSFFKVFFYVSNLTHIFQMGGSTPN